jgi:phosphatidylglycerophosphate synthase
VNLPNGLTVGRIAVAPLIAWLPFVDSWPLRLAAWALFVIAAITDYYDGMLARTRNQVTDLGRLLDPLADKLFLVATFVPMYALMEAGEPPRFPFETPVGRVGLPWWVVAVIVGRELLMTVFRQAAARRGVVIGAIGPAKWKTGFQLVWVGAAYFWFFAATLAATRGWTSRWWIAFADFNGIVGIVTMCAAVVLTMYSLVLYLRRYGGVFLGRAGART